jgi:hypothetical protein
MPNDLIIEPIENETEEEKYQRLLRESQGLPTLDAATGKIEQDEKALPSVDLAASPAPAQPPIQQPDIAQSPDLFRELVKQKLKDMPPAKEASPEEDLMKRFKEAQETRRQDLAGIALREAGAGLGAAIAGRGAKVTGDYKTEKMLATLPVKELEEELKNRKLFKDLSQKNKLADPNSEVSKIYRNYVKKKLKIELPENASAQDLIKMGLKPSTASEKRRFRPRAMTDPKTGFSKDITFDSATGKYLNPENREWESYLTGMYKAWRPKYFIDPDTGEQSVDLPGTPGLRTQFVSGPGRGRSIAQELPEYKSFADVPEEKQKIARAAAKEYGNSVKTHRRSLLSAGKLKSVLKPGVKLAAAVLRTQMPRLMGEVGNLNEFEQKVWEGSPTFRQVISRILNRRFDEDDTLTEQDIGVINQVINLTSEKIQEDMTVLKQPYLESVVVGEGIPNEIFDKLLVPAPDWRGENKIRVRNPQGKIGLINKKQKEAALKQGYTLVEE